MQFRQEDFERLTQLMADKAVPHEAFELLADLRQSERRLIDLVSKALVHVDATCGALKMMDGFAPHEDNDTDTLAADIRAAIAG